MDESRKLGTRDLQSINVGSGPPERESPISPDTMLSVVANEHRRAILHALDDAPEQTLEYDVLVERVANRVRDGHADTMSDEYRQRIRIALHHTHLPKLEAARLIDYESESKSVQFVGGELEQNFLSLVAPYDGHE